LKGIYLNILIKVYEFISLRVHELGKQFKSLRVYELVEEVKSYELRVMGYGNWEEASGGR
jgi:hypothetical protein